MPSRFAGGHEPLRGPPSLGSFQETPTDRYFDSHQDNHNALAPGYHASDRFETDNTTVMSSAPASEADWASDSETAPEEHPLLRDHSPPPPYERAEPIFVLQQNDVESQSSDSSATLFFGETKDTVPRAARDRGMRSVLYSVGNAPSRRSCDTSTLGDNDGRPSAEFDLNMHDYLVAEPPHCQHQYDYEQTRYGLRKGPKCQRIRNLCLRKPQVIRCITIMALLAIAAVAFFWPKSFVSREYHIQTLDHFDFSDSISQNSGLPSDFSGVLRVLSGSAGQATDLRVSVKSISSDLQGGKDGAEWRPERLSTSAEVSLYFRPGLEITRLNIASKNLDVVLSSDLIVTESTTITLNKGRLVSEKFEYSTETSITVQRAKVKGKFALNNLLFFKKDAGSMKVEINPKFSADGQPSKPAILEIIQGSGKLKVKYPDHQRDIPVRDYRTTITSRSGTVGGTILHGTQTTIEKETGDMNINIFPFRSGKGISSLTTYQGSGVTTIEVLKPDLRQSGNSLTKISSSHTSRSGNMKLKYPEEWQGSIYGEAKSGILDFKGDNVTVVERGGAGRPNYIRAQKGDGESKLKFVIDSGIVETTVGE
jgi:hypothetical protein